MPVTTSDSLKEFKGHMCRECLQRTPLARWINGGWVCPDCDQAEKLVELAPDDAPVERGRGVAR